MKYCSLQVTANHFLCVLCKKKIFQTGLSRTHQNVHYAEFSLVIEANKYRFQNCENLQGENIRKQFYRDPVCCNTQSGKS